MDYITKKWKNFTPRQQTLLALGVFALLIGAFYGNTLTNGFVLDDKSQIENNPYVHSWEYLPKVVTGCAWEASLANGCKSTGIHYRPVQALSWIIAWHIAPNPWPFHLFNLVYFLIAAFLVFVFVKMLSKNFFLAFLTGLFFIIHPVNNEVGNFVVLPPDFGLAIFSLSAGIFYFRYHTKKNSLDLKLVYLFYFLAMLSKEPAFIVVPLSLLALDLIVFKLPIRTFVQWSPILKRYLMLSIPAAIYFGMRFLVLGFRGTFLVSASSAGGASPLERVYVFFTLFMGYMREIVYPYPLRFFHNFTVSDALFSLPFIFSFVGVAFFFALVYLVIKKGERIFAFFLSWIVIFFFPLLIFFDMAEMRVFFDRFLFVSSIGFVFGVSYLLNYVWQDKPISPHAPYSRVYRAIAKFDIRTRRIVVVSMVGIMIFSSWAIIFPRNRDWKNFETMYTITLEQTPDAHIIRRDLANEYFQQGDYEKSRVQFQYLIDNAQDWKDVTMAYNGMGDYYLRVGDKEKALEYYLESARTSFDLPRDFVAYLKVGNLYLEQEDHLLALTYFCQAQQLFQTQQTQDNFDAAFIAVDEQFIQPGTLHNEVPSSFALSSIQRIQYLDKRCDDKTCQYAFGYNADVPEVLPPFLITSQTSRSRNVEIINKSYDPGQSIIILETDSSYENTDLTFLFPTCRREYYEVDTAE